MSVYAFCPKCEEKVMVEFNRYLLGTDPYKCLIFVNCGKCGMVLNLDKARQPA